MHARGNYYQIKINFVQSGGFNANTVRNVIAQGGLYAAPFTETTKNVPLTARRLVE